MFLSPVQDAQASQGSTNIGETSHSTRIWFNILVFFLFALRMIYFKWSIFERCDFCFNSSGGSYICWAETLRDKSEGNYGKCSDIGESM